MTAVVSLAAAFVAVASASASAGDGVLAIGGTAEPRDLTTIEAAITAVLRGAAWQLPAKPLATSERDGLLRCLDATDGRCIPASVAAGRALVVTAAKAQATDGTSSVILTGKLIAGEPGAFVVRQRRCEPCTDDSLQRAASALAQELLDELAVRLGRTLIVITTVPEGAHVSLDGREVGASNMNVKTFPGTHAVALTKPGFVTLTRMIEAEDGKTAEVAVTLRSTEVAPVRATSRAARWWLPGAGLVAGGALAAAGGVALLALGSEDGPDDRYRYTHATLLGASALVAGLAAGAYGAYLVTLSPAPDGAVAGVEGRF